MDKKQAQLIIKETFEKPFDKAKFTGFVKNLLNTIQEDTFTYRGNYIPDAYEQYINTLERIGKYSVGEHKIDILIAKLKKETSIERARTMQRNFIAWYLNGSRGGELKDAALVAFVAPNEEDWRFSLVKMDYRFEEGKKGRMRVKEEFTPARRWSFLVGINENSHTAQSQLVDILANDEQSPSLSQLEEAFNIEKVTREFFEKYRELFLWTTETLEEVVQKDKKIKADFEERCVNTVDFAKKLLGQIVFLYFLQKKGWFGVKRDAEWGTGPKNFLRELFESKQGTYKNFFNDILEPLFYEALARERDDDFYSRFNCKIPFLNGGLFDPINNYDWVHTDILLPNDLFSNDYRTDTMTSAGKLMCQQLGSFAEFERNRIIERVFPGMVKGVLKGNWQGASQPPYGYSYKKEKKLLEVVPEEAKTVKLIYTMYLCNKSSIQIGRYLFQNGYRSRCGNPFTGHHILSILKNPVYTGKLLWNVRHYYRTPKGWRYTFNPPEKRILGQGRHEAMIFPDDFEKVQGMLKERRKNFNHRVSPSPYSLTGVLICAKCGMGYTGSSYMTNHRTKKRKPWYCCSGRYKFRDKCGNPAVRAEIIEAQVLDIIDKITEKGGNLTRRIDNVIKAQVEPNEAIKQQIDLVKKELERLLIKQSKLTDVYLDNEIGIQIYKSKNEVLKEEEQNLKKQLNSLEIKLIEKERSRDYLLSLQDVISNFKETKCSLDTQDKKDLVRLMFKWIKIDNFKIVDYELYEPFKGYLEEREKGRDKCQLEEIQIVPRKRSQSCISELLVVK